MGWSLRLLPAWGNPYHCSVALCRGGYREETMLLPGLWNFAWVEAISQHLSYCQSFQFLPIWPSSCCPGAESHSGWVCMSPKLIVGPLRGVSWESHSFFCHPQPPLIFTARSYGDLSSWHWNPGLDGLVSGWDPLLPSYPSWFLSTTWGCGTTRSASQGLSTPLHPSTPHLLCISVSPPVLRI